MPPPWSTLGHLTVPFDNGSGSLMKPDGCRSLFLSDRARREHAHSTTSKVTKGEKGRDPLPVTLTGRVRE